MALSPKERRKLYRSRRWKRLRLAIFDRDQWRCADCGRPGRLECDHASTDPDLFWEPSNLETRCRGCHIEKHRREQASYQFAKRRDAWADFASELA